MSAEVALGSKALKFQIAVRGDYSVSSPYPSRTKDYKKVETRADKLSDEIIAIGGTV